MHDNISEKVTYTKNYKMLLKLKRIEINLCMN